MELFFYSYCPDSIFSSYLFFSYFPFILYEIYGIYGIYEKKNGKYSFMKNMDMEFMMFFYYNQFKNH